nr:MAG TPA: minor structural protein GP20 [Caudoviricetes sp.]
MAGKSKQMKLKLDAQGHVVVQDGKPIYVTDDGQEVAFDAVETTAAIKRLNGEAKGHRERAEAAEKALKAFEGIDPEAAAKALDTVTKLDQKKLIDAGEVDKVRAEITKNWESKLSEAEKAKQALEQQLHNELIGGNFARSKVIAEKLAIPADLVQAAFGSAFKVENGRVVAYDKNGQAIYSKANPSEPAGFDEALLSLVDAYPNKEHILKGSGASGSGAGSSSAGKPTMTLTEQHMAAKNR